MQKKLKIVFFSGTELGCHYASALKNLDFLDIKLVVTGLNKPKGRGRKLSKAVLAAHCENIDLPAFQTSNVNDNDCIEKFSGLDADLAVVVDFGQILSSQLINVFPKGVFNIHYSLLPDLRGPEPVRWALLKNYHKTGVTLMRIDEHVDTGDMISSVAYTIKQTDNYATLKDNLNQLGVELIKTFLTSISNEEKVSYIPQPESNAVLKASKIGKELCCIDWKLSASENFNIIRAMSPVPGAKTNFNSDMLKILRAELLEQESENKFPGTILEINKEYFIVACGEGALKILELQPAGKRVMSAKDYLAGNKLQKGTILS